MQESTQNDVKLPKRVLVALDSESLSDRAIEAGLELVRKFDASIEFVHGFQTAAFGAKFVEDPRDVARGTDLTRAVETRAVEHVRAVLARCKSTLNAEKLVRVIPGSPARAVADRARDSHADLILLGGVRGRSVMDFGSTARAILAKAPCPVLVQSTPFEPIRRILVPLDQSDESRRALRVACAWASAFSARVTAMHCFDSASTIAASSWSGMVAPNVTGVMLKESREAFERETDEFDWGGVEHQSLFLEGSPAQHILAQANSTDLIAMGTHGRTGLAAALLGSVAYSVLKHSTKPVLVLRDDRREFQT